MLKSCQVPVGDSSGRLLALWAKRYKPALNTISQSENPFPMVDLLTLTTTDGRAGTAKRVRQSLTGYCQLAGLKTNSLYTYIPNIINLSEAYQLAQAVELVYRQVLTIYSQQPSLKPFLRYFSDTEGILVELGKDALMLPLIDRLAAELEPVHLALQTSHGNTSNVRTVGFLTTQFHLINQAIMTALTPCEQVLISPYLQFAEEQVAIPWTRVCAVAASYAADAPEIALVEALMTVCPAIALEVQGHLANRFPYTTSRRGMLRNAEVRRSTLRDLTMMQAYLWLAILEKQATAITQELLPLCRMVFPSIDMQPAVVQTGIAQLVNVVEQHIPSPLLHLAKPYTQVLNQCFEDWTPVPTLADLAIDR
ncbi:MAG: hypothetical protein WBG32_12910 [Nodosilinea sp.]